MGVGHGRDAVEATEERPVKQLIAAGSDHRLLRYQEVHRDATIACTALIECNVLQRESAYVAACAAARAEIRTAAHAAGGADGAKIRRTASGIGIGRKPSRVTQPTLMRPAASNRSCPFPELSMRAS